MDLHTRWTWARNEKVRTNKYESLVPEVELCFDTNRTKFIQTKQRQRTNQLVLDEKQKAKLIAHNRSKTGCMQSLKISGIFLSIAEIRTNDLKSNIQLTASTVCILASPGRLPREHIDMTRLESAKCQHYTTTTLPI